MRPRRRGGARTSSPRAPSTHDAWRRSPRSRRSAAQRPCRSRPSRSWRRRAPSPCCASGAAEEDEREAREAREAQRDRRHAAERDVKLAELARARAVRIETFEAEREGAAHERRPHGGRAPPRQRSPRDSKGEHDDRERDEANLGAGRRRRRERCAPRHERGIRDRSARRWLRRQHRLGARASARGGTGLPQRADRHGAEPHTARRGRSRRGRALGPRLAGVHRRDGDDRDLPSRRARRRAWARSGTPRGAHTRARGDRPRRDRSRCDRSRRVRSRRHGRVGRRAVERWRG